MTKHEAHMKAHALWGDDRRSGVVCLRQKKHPARFQVGYQNRSGGAWVVLGESAVSWEDAFAKAVTP